MALKEGNFYFKIDKDKVSYRLINKEVVILHLQRGFYYSLNKTGTLIWQLMENGKGLEEMAEVLSKEFGKPAKATEKDIKLLIRDLEKEELIEKV